MRGAKQVASSNSLLLSKEREGKKVHIIARPLGSDSFLRRKGREGLGQKLHYLGEEHLAAKCARFSYSSQQILGEGTEKRLVTTVQGRTKQDC